MDSEWKPSLKEIYGVNLANYFPHRRSYNSVVFMHKKYLDEHKQKEEKKEKLKPKKENICKEDKSQQFNSEKNTEVSKDRTYKISNHNNDSVLEQTIRFAKNIVPLVIPPSDDKLPVYYTIKTSRKHKKKDKKRQETDFERHEVPYEQEEAKKVIETYRKVRKESFSVRESVSHSSSNTLDDININQSLCCTFSEVSEKKYHKKEKSHNKKQNEGQKFIVSESFEALATENAGDSRIKIHLMNEKDKNFLSDSIKTPILNAIRECIAELNNNNHNTELTTVQKVLRCNTNKLDAILDKITCIEKRLDAQVSEKKLLYKVQMPKTKGSKLEEVGEDLLDAQESEKKPLSKVQMHKSKGSKLEELGEDLIEIKEDYSSEEEMHQEFLDRRSKSAVIELVPDEKSGKRAENLGGGETGSLIASSSVGIKPDRPNRIPARFCWTDVARK